MGTIQFGTSGWRGVMADEFTFGNVRKVVSAIARVLKQSPDHKKPVIVGYDTRFLSPEFARTAADILAKEGFQVLFSKTFVPTPAISFQITHQNALGALNFTASHNPAEYNGIKFNTANGAPASPEITKQIEDFANAAAEEEAGPVPQWEKPEDPKISLFDPRPAYLARLKKIIDTSALKKSRLKIGVDVLYGTGSGYLDEFLLSIGFKPLVLHKHRDVSFGGHSPEPAKEQLQTLIAEMKRQKLTIGLGTDGDADRFGVVDSDGTLLSPNEILPIVLQHLVKTRKWRGTVVRSVMTSHFIDAVAKKFDLPLKETPVGFKYIAEEMLSGRPFVMGGEESGGMTIRGHVPEKDGILACLLMAEVRAVEKKSFREILLGLKKEVGGYESDRVNLHLTMEAMQSLKKHLATLTPSTLHGLSVKKIVRMDGYKFIFEDNSWLGVRLSGTEPVVRLYVEAATPKKLKNLIKVGEQLIHASDH